MSEKISHEALLPVALELFKSVGINKLERINEAATRTERLEKLSDDFIRFYSQLRDKLIKTAQ